MTTLTIDEIRDQIAEWEGWKPISVGGWWSHHNGTHRHLHPVPYTLDEAAKLPEGWHPEITDCTTRNGKPLHPWIAEATHEDTLSVLKGYGPTEIEARFRLRHAAMKAERGIA